MTSNFVRELNIGNYIATKGGHLPYWRITKDDLVTILQSDKQEIYKPVRLTKKILKKFNFSPVKKDKSVYEDDNVYDGYSTGYYFSTTNKIFYFDGEDIYSAVKIEYVHQFQNWYFLLTGKELELK